VVCDRSHVRATGGAVVAGYMLAILSSTIAAAATKEEVARCRVIQQRVGRLDCFKSLKLGPKAKTEHAVPARTEDTTKSKTHKTILSPTSDGPATTSSIDRLSFAPSQPLCVDRDALAAMLVAGVLTSDPAEAATIGCQTIPEDAKLELLERYPSVFPFMRMIMDVGLPDIDGREAVRILRKNGFKAPIIMLTGHDTDSDTILMVKILIPSTRPRFGRQRLCH